jgi:hypothetical protein
VTFTVSRGIEDALAPEKPYTGDVLGTKERVCGAERQIIEYSGNPLRLLCTKMPHHDDPMAEMGGRRQDPNHGCTENRHDGVIVTYSWRSDR